MEVNKFRIALAGYFLIVIMISAINSNRHRDPGTPSGVGFIHAVCDFRALTQPKKTRKPPGRRIQIRGY